jgi:hypothetical protein
MFDKEEVEVQHIKARHHHTPKHSHIGADKDLFKAIATSLDCVGEVLLTGPANAKIEFRGWCKHNPHAVDKAMVDVVTTDHPTDVQVVAMARQSFLKFDQKAAGPTQR